MSGEAPFPGNSSQNYEGVADNSSSSRRRAVAAMATAAARNNGFQNELGIPGFQNIRPVAVANPNNPALAFNIFCNTAVFTDGRTPGYNIGQSTPSPVATTSRNFSLGSPNDKESPREKRGVKRKYELSGGVDKDNADATKNTANANNVIAQRIGRSRPKGTLPSQSTNTSAIASSRSSGAAPSSTTPCPSSSTSSSRKPSGSKSAKPKKIMRLMIRIDPMTAAIQPRKQYRGNLLPPPPSAPSLPSPMATTSTKSTSRWRTEGHTPPHICPTHRALPPPKVEATAPSPPNWEEQLEDTIMSLSTYKIFPVDSTSQEFHTIAKLIKPFVVESVEHIVNPDLWQRFTTTRKEMLRSKTDDMTLLSELGFDEKQVQQREHLSRNFEKAPLLASSSYSPNEALLFHCTRSMENLEQIFKQGLDERLCISSRNQCGKGIYFSDNPSKSILYDGTRGTILVFSVLLGDCLALHDQYKARSLVREPEKTQMQKRNVTDQFFDSITAKPKGHNEYVIYNRHQCCPLYIIKYKLPGRTPDERKTFLTYSRRGMASIAWNPMPNSNPDGSWPFYAAVIFEAMNAVVPKPGPSHTVAVAPSEESAVASSSKCDDDLAVAKESYDSNLKKKAFEVATILGIQNEATVEAALIRFEHDVDLAVNFLLDNKSQPGPTASGSRVGIIHNSNLPEPIQPSHSSGAAGNLITPGKSIVIPQQASDSRVNKVVPLVDLCDDDDEEDEDKAIAIMNQENNLAAITPKEDCFICCNAYTAFSHSPQLWKELNCSHKMCLSCHQKIETSGKTMSGIECVATKCPFCQEITGTLVGNCPMGQMTDSIVKPRCEGYPESRSSIRIKYILLSKTQRFRRVAFLPNTKEGRKVLNLLRIAWERRLIFVIGDSHTTGARNVPVWNIHHKTSIDGGVNSHGYPDPGYLDRVIEELKSYGIQ